jgi:squalene-hopene/tetraprenyl-beta-curcumene cyclase
VVQLAELSAALDNTRLRAAYVKARDALLAERNSEGYWVGELSSSALATATAITALAVTHREPAMIDRGLRWLVEHQNADGGWGDTVKSFSNISTTMLCRAALTICDKSRQHAESMKRCETWLFERYGKTPEQLAEAVRQRYGKDRTFAVPILTMCALAGLVEWHEVPRLPFELACLPQSWYRFARLPVVSYALPALIAIGQCIHHHRGTWNPITGLMRWLGKKRSLRVLERIQPSSGGFLEATPLTSFVVMSLAATGDRVAATRRLCEAERLSPADRVIEKGLEFIVSSMRDDGSWPIDTNLSIWVTTLSINALASTGDLDSLERKGELCGWLMSQQMKDRHPYSGAAPGGWGWSHLPGSVPDCDDSPGALIAQRHLLGGSFNIGRALDWIWSLQNRDGGWPTFCRGWGSLPFDRSGPDLTAHAIRAFGAELAEMRAFSAFRKRFLVFLVFYEPHPNRLNRAIRRGLRYLSRQQRPDGSWLPLWFGNQHAPDEINPTYGTAKVLAAYRDLDLLETPEAQRGIAYLLSTQNADGGWGGAKDTPSIVEETALAVEILCDRRLRLSGEIERGIEYLVKRVEDGTFTDASPIGFYFAKLWYFEKLYPIIFTVAALGRALTQIES